MIKKNLRTLLLTSLIILLPLLIGLLLWDQLPDTLSTHWGMDGAIDGTMPKLTAILLTPVILLACHWFCIIISSLDPRNKEQNRKALNMVFWIFPAVSLFSALVIYGSSLGLSLNPARIMYVLIGLVFLIFGNYMPKCRQNSSIGIRLPWTLQNEENWNRTHRLAGKLWLAGGSLLLLCCLLPEKYSFAVMFAILMLLILITMSYSYLLYRKQLKNGATISNSETYRKQSPIVKLISTVSSVIVLAAVAILLFTGSIKTELTDTELTITSTYWSDLEVTYDTIESLEYRDTDDVGMRTNGFGSLKLLMGTFKNAEFGYYTRYSYAGNNSCIILRLTEDTLVLNTEDAESTKALFEALLAKLSQTP